jgi:hypothetical protein
MQVIDYNLQNKGAAVNGSKNEVNDPHLFTYFFDQNCNNLHICVDQEDDKWVTQRDNGKALNMDAAIIARLTNYNKPRA